MQNIEETDWEKLQAQLGTANRLRQSAEQEYNKVVLNFLREHTRENQCFTETIVLKNNRLKMAYTLGEMYRSLILGRKLDPLPLFLIDSTLYYTLDNNRDKGAGPIELHDLPKDMNPLDDLNFLKLLERKVQEENTDPEVFIPEGFMAFRFQAIWGAGGYDDDHPTPYTVPIETESIDDGFSELKRILFNWDRENSFGAFWIAMPGADKWEKLTVEPAYANLTPSISKFSLDELKLVKDKL